MRREPPSDSQRVSIRVVRCKLRCTGDYATSNRRAGAAQAVRGVAFFADLQLRTLQIRDDPRSRAHVPASLSTLLSTSLGVFCAASSSASFSASLSQDCARPGLCACGVTHGVNLNLTLDMEETTVADAVRRGNPVVFFDITISGQPVGRMKMVRPRPPRGARGAGTSRRRSRAHTVQAAAR